MSEVVSKFKNLISVISVQSQNKQQIELRGSFQTNLTILPDVIILISEQSSKF